jgi:hypothetical protein
MQQVTNIFVAGLMLIVLGILAAVILYTMIPTQIQAQNDLLNADVSGVDLSSSQTNLVTNLGNLQLIVMLLVPALIVLAGIIVIIYTAFKGSK